MDGAEGEPVQLYVYDLSRGIARQWSPMLLGKQIDGIWHSAIVVGGIEYYYGFGINVSIPGQTPFGQPTHIYDLGTTYIPEEVRDEFLADLFERYTPAAYSLLHNNCNSFADELAQLLVGRGIPPHITGLPAEVMSTPFGQMIAPMLQSMEQQLGSVRQQAFHPHHHHPHPSHPAKHQQGQGVELGGAGADALATVAAGPSSSVAAGAAAAEPAPTEPQGQQQRQQQEREVVGDGVGGAGPPGPVASSSVEGGGAGIEEEQQAPMEEKLKQAAPAVGRVDSHHMGQSLEEEAQAATAAEAIAQQVVAATGLGMVAEVAQCVSEQGRGSSPGQQPPGETASNGGVAVPPVAPRAKRSAAAAAAAAAAERRAQSAAAARDAAGVGGGASAAEGDREIKDSEGPEVAKTACEGAVRAEFQRLLAAGMAEEAAAAAATLAVAEREGGGEAIRVQA